MHYGSPVRVDATKILTRRELSSVLADLQQRVNRSRHSQANLILVRLACCCGLRASEIAALQGPICCPLKRPAMPPTTNNPVTTGEMVRPAQICEAIPETLTSEITISDVPTAR